MRLFILPLFLFLQVSPTSTGQSLYPDYCKITSNCAPTLACRHLDNGQTTECTSSSFSLFCQCDGTRTLCRTASDCTSNEVCSNRMPNAAANGVCISKAYADWIVTLNPSLGFGGGSVTVTEYDGFPCRNNAQCVQGKKCYDVFGGRECSGAVTLECLCLGNEGRRQSCIRESDCEEGEVCSNQAEGTKLRVGVCMSRSLAEAVAGRVSGVEVGKRVCVAAEFLVRGKGVYGDAVLANVLCDVGGSCATEGHLVKWGGNVMMMKTYCERVGCVKRVKFVNSPKYERGGVVGSKTKGLVFTMFAARYGTGVEERLLTALVNLGL